MKNCVKKSENVYVDVQTNEQTYYEYDVIMGCLQFEETFIDVRLSSKSPFYDFVLNLTIQSAKTF